MDTLKGYFKTKKSRVSWTMFKMEFQFWKLIKIIEFRCLRANKTVGCSEYSITFAQLKSRVRRGVVVITIAQLNSTKPRLRFYTCSKPTLGVMEIRNGEDLSAGNKAKRLHTTKTIHHHHHHQYHHDLSKKMRKSEKNEKKKSKSVKSLIYMVDFFTN